MSSKKNKKAKKRAVAEVQKKKAEVTVETKEVVEDIVEIKEIVERKPETVEGRTRSDKWYAKVASCVKQMACKVSSSTAQAWEGAQKETRHWLTMLAAAGVLLLLAVILLSLRLHGISEELETAQAMSTSLQMELDSAKESVRQGELKLLEMETPSAMVTPLPTSTPLPTATPTPTPTIVVDKHIVCVDAGHGDWDGGATLKDEKNREVRIEKNDNLWMAQMFRDALEAYDVEVVMTRDEDVFLELSERTTIANSIEADVLISFHRNAYATGDQFLVSDASGAEIWIHNSKPAGANELAGRLLAAITEVGGMKNRGVKYGSMSGSSENYAINREANMTSMIIELGFVTSEDDNAAYDEYGQAYAEAMARVVYEWLEAQEK